MSLTKEQVEHIANLARLELSAEEISRYRQQLSAILEFFDQLQAVNTDDIPPTSGVQPSQSKLRTDNPQPGLELDEILSNAPKAKDRQFQIPPVFEEKT